MLVVVILFSMNALVGLACVPATPDGQVGHSREGDAVYDPFVGSGTTIIAAEQLGRRCLAIEIDPTYVDVAVRRWETETGRAAELVRAPIAA